MSAQMNLTPKTNFQIPLVLTINEDDELLYNSADCRWYKILRDFQDDNYIDLGAAYYNCLYNFNILQKAKNGDKNGPNNEAKDEARQRLLFERATMDSEQPVLYEQPAVPEAEAVVTPSMIGPGITPNHGAGKKPKCFFSLFKSFIGAPLMGFGSEPERVHDLLRSNLHFARVCGFIPKGQNDPYWQKHIPSLRKFQQFDQIMTEYGLWNKSKRQEIIENLANGTIRKENSIVGDTTHFYGYSGFETVKYVDENGKEVTKSQSKVTKNCRCEDREACPHEWQLADDGAGTIVKAHNKYIWGHKASILGLPLQGIPLDAAAVADAATYDGKTFYPHAERLFNEHPVFKDWIDIAMYDKACDDRDLKEKFEKGLGITLKTSLNPRKRKTINDLPQKCMDKMTPYGTLVCKGGFEMDYKGVRFGEEMFIYKAPENACFSCECKLVCCPDAKSGRTVQIPFDTLPHISPKDPIMSKRFKAMMTRRPSVERMIKRLKCDLGDDRLKKRSNQCFQAYLDKTMIAFHILLRS